MREFVQLPRNTVSTLISRIGVPACQAHVGQRPLGGLAVAGVGHGVGVRAPSPAIGATWAGLVPQVTCGVMAAASSTTSLSKVAPSSVGSVRQ